MKRSPSPPLDRRPLDRERMLMLLNSGQHAKVSEALNSGKHVLSKEDEEEIRARYTADVARTP